MDDYMTQTESAAVLGWSYTRLAKAAERGNIRAAHRPLPGTRRYTRHLHRGDVEALAGGRFLPTYRPRNLRPVHS